MATSNTGTSASTNPHVIIIDDSKFILMVMEKMFSTRGFTVTAFDGGINAAAYLGLNGETVSEDLKVDLIVTDFDMPDMTGLELLINVKNSSKWKQVPVCIMSSDNEAERVERCYKEGAVDYLAKPVKADQVERLKQLIVAHKTAKSN